MSNAFNCVFDASELRAFNGAIGFTERDVRRAVTECLGYAPDSPELQHILATLQLWGNSYRFAPGLGPSDGMFQTVMVTHLLLALRDVLATRSLTLAALQEWLGSWVPSGPVGTDPEEQLLGYFMSSGAMNSLLPKLVASAQHLPAPTPLSRLHVQQQVAAASVSQAAHRDSLLLRNWALVDSGGSPVADEAEQTLVRTMYYEGLLTHSAAGASASDGKHASGGSLRVPNEQMHSRFIQKFAALVAADPRKPHAADVFLADGDTQPLAAALTDLCRQGLSRSVLASWSESHYAERLMLLLSTARSMRFRWRREARTHRVYRNGGKAYTGNVDIVGTCGNRTIIIELKQMNVVHDLKREYVTETLQQQLDAAAALLMKQLHHADSDDVQHLAKAQVLADLPMDLLLDVKFSKPSGDKTETNSGSAPACTTVKQLQVDAATQVQQYARGWLKMNSERPSSGLELYTAVAVGPLRWLVQRVPVVP